MADTANQYEVAFPDGLCAKVYFGDEPMVRLTKPMFDSAAMYGAAFMSIEAGEEVRVAGLWDDRPILIVSAQQVAAICNMIKVLTADLRCGRYELKWAPDDGLPF